MPSITYDAVVAPDYTVADEASKSSLVKQAGRTLGALKFPSALEATTALVQFYGALNEDDTPTLLYDDADTPAKLSVPVQLSAWVTFDADLVTRLAQWPFLQIELANSSGSAVAQNGGPRAITGFTKVI